MRESTIERYLCKRVKEAGGQCYKFVSPGRRNVPDRMVVLPGRRPIFVELKAPGGELRPGQRREHERMRALGLQVRVISLKGEVEMLLDFYT